MKSKAADKAAALDAVDKAPPPTEDFYDKLAQKAKKNADPNAITEFKVRCPQWLVTELDRTASETRFRRNGLVKHLLEIGLKEFKARKSGAPPVNGDGDAD